MKNHEINLMREISLVVVVLVLLGATILPYPAEAAQAVEKFTLHVRDRTAVMGASKFGDGTEGKCIFANVVIGMFEHASTSEDDTNPSAAAFVDIYYFDLCRGQLTAAFWSSQSQPGLTDLSFTARSAHLGATIDTSDGPANLDVSWSCDGQFSRSNSRNLISDPSRVLFMEKLQSQTCTDAKVSAILTLGSGEAIILSDSTLDYLFGELRKQTTGQVSITHVQ